MTLLSALRIFLIEGIRLLSVPGITKRNNSNEYQQQSHVSKIQISSCNSFQNVQWIWLFGNCSFNCITQTIHNEYLFARTNTNTIF